MARAGSQCHRKKNISLDKAIKLKNLQNTLLIPDLEALCNRTILRLVFGGTRFAIWMRHQLHDSIFYWFPSVPSGSCHANSSTKPHTPFPDFFNLAFKN